MTSRHRRIQQLQENTQQEAVQCVQTAGQNQVDVQRLQDMLRKVDRVTEVLSNLNATLFDLLESPSDEEGQQQAGREEGEGGHEPPPPPSSSRRESVMSSASCSSNPMDNDGEPHQLSRARSQSSSPGLSPASGAGLPSWPSVPALPSLPGPSLPGAVLAPLPLTPSSSNTAAGQASGAGSGRPPPQHASTTLAAFARLGYVPAGGRMFDPGFSAAMNPASGSAATVRARGLDAGVNSASNALPAMTTVRVPGLDAGMSSTLGAQIGSGFVGALPQSLNPLASLVTASSQGVVPTMDQRQSSATNAASVRTVVAMETVPTVRAQASSRATPPLLVGDAPAPGGREDRVVVGLGDPRSWGEAVVGDRAPPLSAHFQQMPPSVALPMGMGGSTQPGVPSVPVTQERPLGRDKLRANVRVPVVVIHVENPWSFYVVRSQQLLQKLTTQINQHVWKTWECHGSVGIGSLCLAQYGDGVFYRAQVQHLYPDGNVAVNFVDYGNLFIAKVSKLLALPQDLRELPALAIHCCLSEVGPSSRSGAWTQKAIDEFQELVIGEEITCLPLPLSRVYPHLPLLVELGQHETSIKRHLIQNQLACPILNEILLARVEKSNANRLSAAQASSTGPHSALEEEPCIAPTTERVAKPPEGRSLPSAAAAANTVSSDFEQVLSHSQLQNILRKLPKLTKGIKKQKEKELGRKQNENVPGSGDCLRSQSVMDRVGLERKQALGPAGDFEARQGGDFEARQGGDFEARQGGDFEARHGGDFKARQGGDFEARQSAQSSGGAQKSYRQASAQGDPASKEETAVRDSCAATSTGRGDDGTQDGDNSSTSTLDHTFQTLFRSLTGSQEYTSFKAMAATVISPTDFYLHRVCPETGQLLENIVRELNDRFSKMAQPLLRMCNRRLEAKSGVLCCAQFKDDMFYRGRILKTESLEGGGKRVLVFFVDFGDTAWVPRSQVFSLPEEFRTINPQAVWCTLAGVRPLSSAEERGDVGWGWEEKTVQEFDRLLEGDRVFDIVAGGQLPPQKDRADAVQTEPLPVILVDRGEEDLCINHDLIVRNLAAPHIRPSPSSSAETGEEVDAAEGGQLDTSFDSDTMWQDMELDARSLRNTYKVDIEDPCVAATGVSE
ncbi:hypothetical protein ACOMHN_021581 [Nucella lapillus]